MSNHCRTVRVCFIAPKAYPLFNPETTGVIGGIEVDFYNLSTELAKDKAFEVSFITADYGQADVQQIKGVRVVKSLRYDSSALVGALKLWKAMQQCNADIYFQEGTSAGTYLVGLFCKLRGKTFVYRSAHRNDCDGTYLQQHPVNGRLFRSALRHAAKVIVQNRSDQYEMLRTVGVASVVIPNAHHLSEVTKACRWRILWVGRSADYKRPELFIDLARYFPDEKFTMICQKATGDERYDELKSQAATIENLQFIQRVPYQEIDSYFCQAKLFVCTSRGEGFPNTYVQACKNATPIVSLSVNPDNFLNEYRCGLCAEGDWDKFVRQVKQMLDPATSRQYGRNARSYAEQKHDIKRIIEVYKGLFRELVNRKDVR